MAIILVFIVGVLLASLCGVTIYFTNRAEDVNRSKHSGTTAEELLRYRTIDEMVRRFQDLSDSGEVNYFSMNDIRKVADEMKDIK